MAGFPINIPNAPLTDGNGMVTREWYRFFSNVQNMVGGPVSPFDDSALLAGPNGIAALAMPLDEGLGAATRALLATEDTFPPQPVFFSLPDDMLQPYTPNIPATKSRANRTVTASATLTLSDDIVFADATLGPLVVTLPSASSASGNGVFVKKIDTTANAVTIIGTDPIDGMTSVQIAAPYTCLTLFASFSGWFII